MTFCPNALPQCFQHVHFHNLRQMPKKPKKANPINYLYGFTIGMPCRFALLCMCPLFNKWPWSSLMYIRYGLCGYTSNVEFLPMKSWLNPRCDDILIDSLSYEISESNNYFESFDIFSCRTRYVDGTPTSEVIPVTIRYIRPPHHDHTSQYHGHEWMTRILCVPCQSAIPFLR